MLANRDGVLNGQVHTNLRCVVVFVVRAQALHLGGMLLTLPSYFP